MRRLGNQAKAEPIRALRISLDDIADADDEKENTKLGILMERIQTIGVNAVLIDAYARPQGNKLISEVYFPSSNMEVRRDLFNRATWQIRKRLGIRVFAVMRTELKPKMGNTHQASDTALTAFRDLARHAIFQGIVIDHSGSSIKDIAYLRKLVEKVEYYRKPSDVLFEGILVDQHDQTAVSSKFLSESAFLVVPDQKNMQPLLSDTKNAAISKNDFRQRVVTYMKTTSLDPGKYDLAGRVRELERAGARNIVVDEQTSLQDAVRLDWIRRALSVKVNPYLATSP
jgi:hypothetical protein